MTKIDYIESVLNILKSPDVKGELELALDFIESKGLCHDYLEYREDYLHDKKIPFVIIEDGPNNE